MVQVKVVSTSRIAACLTYLPVVAGIVELATAIDSNPSSIYDRAKLSPHGSPNEGRFPVSLFYRSSGLKAFIKTPGCKSLIEKIISEPLEKANGKGKWITPLFERDIREITAAALYGKFRKQFFPNRSKLERKEFHKLTKKFVAGVHKQIHRSGRPPLRNLVLWDHKLKSPLRPDHLNFFSQYCGTRYLRLPIMELAQFADIDSRIHHISRVFMINLRLGLFPSQLEHFKDLKVLHAVGCGITRIAPQFKDGCTPVWPNLRVMNLEDNPISYITERFLKALPSKAEVDVKGATFVCRCHEKCGTEDSFKFTKEFLLEGHQDLFPTPMDAQSA